MTAPSSNHFCGRCLQGVSRVPLPAIRPPPGSRSGRRTTKPQQRPTTDLCAGVSDCGGCCMDTVAEAEALLWNTGASRQAAALPALARTVHGTCTPEAQHRSTLASSPDNHQAAAAIVTQLPRCKQSAATQTSTAKLVSFRQPRCLA